MDDGVEHEYLMTEGYLWTGQYPEAKRVIEKGNNQSMELYEPTLDGFWSENDNGKPSFFIINEAVISKLCILGEDVEPCFEGSQIIRVQFSFDEGFQKKLFNMMEQVKQMKKEGGTDSVEDVKTPEMDEQVVEEEAKKEPEVVEEEAPEVKEEVAPEEAHPEQEDEHPEQKIEDKKVEYNLEEVQEYIELKSKYDELETKYNNMKADYEQLVEFKKVADRKEKQEMIDRFYMLTDAEKKDVIDNIDTYSVDDIEAKLSVICVRNKVSFDLDDDGDKDKKPINTFGLDDSGIDDDMTPSWIKAAIATKKEME